MATLILIVEDDGDISQMLNELLTGQGYETMQAFSGTEALLCLEKRVPEAVILDLMLPGMDGEDVLRGIKEDYPRVGVIVSSARDDVQTRVSLLRAGADDYVVKPFDTEELLARLEAVLRRRTVSGESVNSAGAQEALTYKNLTIYPESLQVQAAKQEVSLTKREYMILELLMRHPGKVFTKSNIYESVWNEEFLGEENAVNVHISNIRQKLAKICPQETYIQTVWGIGFKMG
ncbi:MAG: response regulator transcription factor [Lachnospiraceae bacterium]|nr:response regulator transcription factor [Lachnospiraceae bacterium]